MGMVVRTNTMALNAYRQLGMNNSAVAKSLEKLSSGFRINRAGDDAAGLAISEKMKAQITGLETASSNAQDGISLIQTAEGNLTEVHSMLNRMVELATKSANGTYQNEVDREALQAEMDQLLEEVDRISKSANFNGIKLLDGTMGMNTEAMKIGDSTAYKPTGSVSLASAVTVPDDHISGTQSEVKPKFTVDFSEYKASLTSKTTTAGKATVTFDTDNGKIQTYDTISKKWVDSFELVPTAAGTAGDPIDITANDVQGLFNDGDLVKIGDDAYEVSGSANGKVTFTWKGTANADGETAASADTTAKVTEDTWTPVGAVGIGIEGDGTNHETDSIVDPTVRSDCDITKVDDPVVGGEKLRAGATLTLTADMVQNGSSLKIGNTVFTFDNTNTGLSGSGDAYTIGTKDVANEDLLKYVTEQLSNATANVTKTGATTATSFAINRVSDDTIHIDESAPTGGADYAGFTADEMKNAFSQTTPEVMANTKLTITDNDKLADEVKIQVDGKDYTFNKGADLDETMNNLQTALGGDYTVDTTTDSEGNGIVTISAKSASTEAPTLAGSGLTLQIGDTADPFNKMNVKVADMSAKGLGLEHLKTNGIMNESNASKAIDTIKNAINTVSSTRADMGALQNRLEHTINNLDVAVENLSAANSRIRDTDMAKEMMNYTKMNVLVQSAQAMLAQANQQPQSVLQLLQ